MPAWKRLLLRHAGRLAALLGLLALATLIAGVGALAGWWRGRALWVGSFFGPLFAVVLLAVWTRWQRERVLRESPLPQFLKRKLRDIYPQLSGKDADLVERGLRQFFLACLRSNRQFVAMPSRVVDALWHEFILHTQAYRDWCELALGWFLHHTPAEALSAQARRNDGLRRTWYWCCKEEAINPRQPSRLPLLFALDAKLQIAGGFHYLPDCRDIARKNAEGGQHGVTYCGTSFSDGSASGDAGSFGGADSSDGGSDGGDDGGGGCGGGGGD
ncbi:MAG: glycine-rich domain-containing protein [Burkholderiaceae bacterium]